MDFSVRDNVKNNKTMKLLLLNIFIILMVIILTITGVFAYKEAYATNTQDVTGTVLSQTFLKGTDIGPVLDPLADGVSSIIKVTNNNENAINTEAILEISNISETLKDQSFKYILLTSTDRDFTNCSSITTATYSDCDMAASGDFELASTQNGLSLGAGIPVAANSTLYYKLIIYIDGTQENNHDIMIDNLTGLWRVIDTTIYTITLDNKCTGTGTPGTEFVYESYGSKFYHDSNGNKMTTTSYPITIPTCTGYSFGGYYTSVSGGSIRLTSTGYLASELSTTSITSNQTWYGRWSANIYNIALESNDAATHGTEMIYEKYNDGYYLNNNATNKMSTSANKINKPAKTGYTFNGYYVNDVPDNNCGNGPYIGSNEFLTSTASNTYFTTNGTLHACFNSNIYNISLNGQGATTQGSTAVYEKYDVGIYLNNNNGSLTNEMTTSSNPITNPEKQYTIILDYNYSGSTNGSATATHNFLGYFTESGDNGTELIGNNGKIKDAFTNTYFDSDNTLYAHWSGGTIDTFPDNPERTGYTFNGWYTEASGGTQVTSNTVFDNNNTTNNSATIYAHWTPIQYTVQFNSSDSTNCPLSATVYGNINASYGSNIKNSAIANPTCTGYTFTGWTASGDINITTAKYGTTNNPNTAWVDGNKGTYFKNLTTTINGTVTLTAGWEPALVSYTVNHYTRNMGSNTYTLDSTDNSTALTGSTLTLANLVKTITGFTYLEGYANAGNTTKPSSGAVTTTTVLADGSRVINLYYRRNRLFVRYHVNGGSMDDPHGTGYGIDSDSFVTYTENGTANRFYRGVYGGYVGDINNTTYEATNGLHDYNAAGYINLDKPKFRARNNTAWNTKADGTGTSYSQETTTYLATTMASQANTYATTNHSLDTGDVIINLYVNWEPALNIFYNANGGSMASQHGANFSLDIDGTVKYGVYKLRDTYFVGDSIATYGLYNYNDPDNVNLQKTDYLGKLHEEWCANSNGTGPCYDHRATSTTGYTPQTFCSTLTGSNPVGCDITLYVNWVPDHYDITYKDCGNTNFSGTHANGYPTGYTYRVGVTLDTPTKTGGFEFGGYYASSACDGTPVPSVSNTDIGDKTFYAKWNDIEDPEVSLEDSDDDDFEGLGKTTQNATLKCSDNVGVTKYYWGTTEPTTVSSLTTTTNLSSLTSSSGLPMTISSAGTYWLACRDAAGNWDKKSVVINSYVVNNELLTADGDKDVYTSSNYVTPVAYQTTAKCASSAPCLVKNGTELTLSSIYTVPTGSNANKFKGYSTTYSSTASTLSTTAPTLSANSTYYTWFNRNYAYIRTQVQQSDETFTNNGTSSTTYTWSLDSNNYIVRTTNSSGSSTNLLSNVRYATPADSNVLSINMYNYTGGVGYFSILNLGHIARSGEEYICIDCNTTNLTIDQDDFSSNDTTTDLCDASTDDCYVKVRVNWTLSGYEINYNLNGGTLSTSCKSGITDTVNPTSSTYTSSVKICNPTKDGFVFAGWTSTTLGSSAKTGTSALNINTAWNGTATTNIYFKNLRENGTVTMVANWTDNQGPVCDDISVTNTLGQTTQTATLSCTDNVGVVKYYFGKSSSGVPNTNITSTPNMLINNAQVNSDGTWYLIAEDAAGNRSTVKTIDIYKYIVNNKLLTANGTKDSYTSSNYVTPAAYQATAKCTSSAPCIAPNGTSLTLSSIYTIPTGSRAGNFKGYSTTYSSTASTLSTTAPTLSANSTYYTWFNRNYAFIRIQVQNDETFTNNGTSSTTYTWSLDSNNYIVRTTNPSGPSITGFNQVRYTTTSDTNLLNTNMYNYNSGEGYYRISKSGYVATSGAEYICTNCNGGNITFNQDTYSTNNTTADLCNASTDDCYVTAKVNWTGNTQTVNIKENGSAATTTGYSVSLSTSDSTDDGSGSLLKTSTGSSVTFSQVPNGTYYIWAGRSDYSETSRVYSGVTLEVNNNNVTKTINYYGLTVLAGTGIDSVTNGSTSNTTIMYLYNSSNPRSISINATVSSGYAWGTWTKTSGTDLNTFTPATQSQYIKMGPGATTVTASANTVATVTIRKNDANWSNSGMKVALYKNGSEQYAYANATVSGATVKWTGLNAGTYNVYASYSSGTSGKDMMRDTGQTITVTSSPTATIDYYGVTRIQGANTTLTTRYETSSGTSFTTSPMYFLKNQDIYITYTSPSGYIGFLWVCGTIQSSGYTHTVTGTCEIETTATSLVSVYINKNGSSWANSGMKVALYQNGTEQYSYSSGNVTSSSVNWTDVAAGTYNVYASYSSGTSGQNVMRDTGETVSVGSGNVATIDYYGITRSQGANTTLTTRYDNSSGTSFTTSPMFILENQNIYITASASSGYTANLTVCGTARTSGYTHTVTGACTVATTTSNTPPTCSISTTDNLGVTSQTATLTGTDDNGIVAYYWGTSSSPADGDFTTITKTTNMSVSKTVTAANTGKYYLITKDEAGFTCSAANKQYYTYQVDNMFQNVSSVGDSYTYTTTDYTKKTASSDFQGTLKCTSSSKCIAPSGTTLTLSSIRTIPKHSKSGSFVGYSEGAASGTAASPSTTPPTLNGNKTYTMWFNRNWIYFKVHLPSGETLTNGSGTTYDWALDSDRYINRTTESSGTTVDYVDAIKYRGTSDGTGSLNFYDYNSSTYYKISKSGYIAVSGAEYTCVDGCASGFTTMTQDSLTTTNTDTQFCDTTTGNCTVTLRVNWTGNTQTVNIKENGSAATTTGYSVSLSTSDSNDTATKTATSTGSSVTFSQVPDGNYYIWAGRSDRSKTSRIYSGVPLTVNSNNVTKTINYYGLTVLAGDGITDVTNGGITDSPSVSIMYLYNSSNPRSISINATVSSGYTWGTWTKTSGTDLATFTPATKSQYVQMGAGATTLTATAADPTPPTVTLSSSANLGVTSQTATLKCSDNIDVTKYYWGTTEPTALSSLTTTTDLSSLTSSSGLSKTISSAGTYWLACRDAAGNWDKQSVVIYSYQVDNMFQNVASSGSSYTYTTTDYTKKTSSSDFQGTLKCTSSSKCIAPSGTTLTLSSIRTIPKHSRSGGFVGYTLGAASTTTPSPGPSTTSPTLSANNSIYTMWFNRNWIYFKVHLPSGETLTNGSGTTYDWSLDSNRYINRTTESSGTTVDYVDAIKYRGTSDGTGSYNAYNYDSPLYYAISKSGYTAVPGAQYICVDGCASGFTTMSHDSFDVTDTDTQFCDTTTGSCTVTLRVNWTENQVTITVNKNGSAWSSSGMYVALYSGTSSAYTYSDATKSDATVSWNGVAAGTYNIYVSKDENHKTTLVDSGVDIVVSSNGGSATVNFYTLYVGRSTGMASTTVNGTSIANQGSVVVSGGTTPKHSLGGSLSTGYSFNQWAVTNSSYNTQSLSQITTSLSYSNYSVTSETYIYAQATAKQYTVTYDYNLFTAYDRSLSGLSTSSWDEANQTMTLNGTLTNKDSTLGKLFDMSLSGTYKVTLTYVSGTCTSSVTPSLIFDFQKNGSDYNPRNSNTHYINTDLPHCSVGNNPNNLTSNNMTNSITYSLSDANGIRYWIWQSAASGTTFTNYKVKVSVTKVDSKTVTYNSTYGTLPTPVKSGSKFEGWYTALNGGTNITSSSTVSTASNHTLYAHWTGYAYTFQCNSGTIKYYNKLSDLYSGAGNCYGSSYNTKINVYKTVDNNDYILATDKYSNLTINLFSHAINAATINHNSARTNPNLTINGPGYIGQGTRAYLITFASTGNLTLNGGDYENGNNSSSSAVIRTESSADSSKLVLDDSKAPVIIKESAGCGYAIDSQSSGNMTIRSRTTNGISIYSHCYGIRNKGKILLYSGNSSDTGKGTFPLRVIGARGPAINKGENYYNNGSSECPEDGDCKNNVRLGPTLSSSGSSKYPYVASYSNILNTDYNWPTVLLTNGGANQGDGTVYRKVFVETGVIFSAKATTTNNTCSTGNYSSNGDNCKVRFAGSYNWSSSGDFEYRFRPVQATTNVTMKIGNSNSSSYYESVSGNNLSGYYAYGQHS